jgi:hypothetical protein
MKLIQNENPLWSKKHLDFFKEYEQSYGINISEDDYQAELNNIVNGRPSQRCFLDQKCYGIYENEHYLGDIIINEDNEIDIFIFDEYSGNGYAYGALKLFLEEYQIIGACVEAIIRGKNDDKEKIKSVLKKLGFIKGETYNEGNEVWRLFR